MAGRIVVFGATGYTGDLTARALVRDGARPVLAGRDAERLAILAHELGGLDTAVADVERPASVRELVERGDVLVTTVGPYVRFGRPALEAAVDAAAHYLDATGEGSFIRQAFEEYGPRAERVECALLPAFGYDFVPGNLAAALALREAEDDGRPATRVEVFYVTSAAGASAGTMTSLVGVMLRPGFGFHGGRLTSERQGAHVASFRWQGRSGAGMSISGSEHLSLPRLHPALRDVGVYVGVPGAQTWQLQVASATLAPAQIIEPLGRMVESGWSMVSHGSSGGPDESTRRRTRAGALARVMDDAGAILSEVRLEGADPYGFTAGVLAWGAARAAAGGLQRSGTVGPVEGFGLEALRAGAEQAGMRAV
jgi:NAD(P)-dependent dehydrogenase (short-subunit alcohol dehydrogenase family)